MKNINWASGTTKAYFGGVVEVGELPATVFLVFSIEPVRDIVLFSIEEVLVKNPLSIELPRVRDPRDTGFETLVERGCVLTT